MIIDLSLGIYAEVRDKVLNYVFSNIDMEKLVPILRRFE